MNTESGTVTLHQRALPLFINEKNKIPYFIVLYILAASMYLTSNHYQIFTPQYLPMTWIDRAIPLVPSTLWVYMSEYLYFIFVYFSVKNIVTVNKFVYAFMAQQLFAVTIFWIWPTTFPREMYPIPEDVGQLTYQAFDWLRTNDTPANCCPSSHVSGVYISSFIFLREKNWKFPFFFTWATLVAVSTLTTKQHYLVDVVAGFLVAVVFYLIFFRLAAYRQPGGSSSNSNA